MQLGRGLPLTSSREARNVSGAPKLLAICAKTLAYTHSLFTRTPSQSKIMHRHDIATPLTWEWHTAVRFCAPPCARSRATVPGQLSQGTENQAGRITENISSDLSDWLSLHQIKHSRVQWDELSEELHLWNAGT